MQGTNHIDRLDVVELGSRLRVKGGSKLARRAEFYSKQREVRGWESPAQYITLPSKPQLHTGAALADRSQVCTLVLLVEQWH